MRLALLLHYSTQLRMQRPGKGSLLLAEEQLAWEMLPEQWDNMWWDCMRQYVVGQRGGTVRWTAWWIYLSERALEKGVSVCHPY